MQCILYNSSFYDQYMLVNYPMPEKRNKLLSTKELGLLNIQYVLKILWSSEQSVLLKGEFTLFFCETCFRDSSCPVN